MQDSISSDKTRKPAYPRLLRVLSYVGLFVLIAFPIGMLFGGFCTMEVDCVRKQAGRPPDCAIREARLFGLFDRRDTALGVTGVGYRTRDVSTTARVVLASAVELTGTNGVIPVSKAISNVGTGWKSDMIGKIQRYLDAPNEEKLSLVVHERNLFGWIAVAYIGFFFWSYLYWFYRKVTGRA